MSSLLLRIVLNIPDFQLNSRKRRINVWGDKTMILKLLVTFNPSFDWKFGADKCEEKGNSFT